jgi:hypothetical protein
MFKYEIGDIAYYIINNRVHSAKITSRFWFEGSSDAELSNVHTSDGFYQQHKLVSDKIYEVYETCHGRFSIDLMFISRQALCDSIMGVEEKAKELDSNFILEIKRDRYHYFVDDKDRFQGEYKEWYANGQLRFHCFCVDDELHGERKRWDKDGTLISHNFYVGGEVYRDLLENPVTDEDKFLITSETGGKWLC